MHQNTGDQGQHNPVQLCANNSQTEMSKCNDREVLNGSWLIPMNRRNKRACLEHIFLYTLIYWSIYPL